MERTDTHGGHRTRLRQRVREAGLDARADRQDTEEAIVLTIRIPKQKKI